MSLKLSGGLDCKTTSGGAGFSEGYEIRLGEEYITPEDFVKFVMYVMTNTDLAPNDPPRNHRFTAPLDSIMKPARELFDKDSLCLR